VATQAQIQGLREFARWGFTLERLDDLLVELHHQGEFVARFSQAEATEQNLQAECARHLVIKHGWDGCLWSRSNEGEGTESLIGAWRSQSGLRRTTMGSVTELQNDIRRNGHIATLRRARKEHHCSICGFPIEPGQEYYEVVAGGGGLGWLKFPDRCHVGCLNQYLERGR